MALHLGVGMIFIFQTLAMLITQAISISHPAIISQQNRILIINKAGQLFVEQQMVTISKLSNMKFIRSLNDRKSINFTKQRNL